MKGAWATAVSRRFLHHETFQLVVAPAIADLQFEARSGRIIANVRNYLAIGVALCGGICRDIGGDVLALQDDLPTLIGISLIQISYYACLLIVSSGLLTKPVFDRFIASPDPLGMVLLFSILGSSVAVTVVCFWPDRRTAPDDGQ